MTRERNYGFISYVAYFLIGLLMVVIPYETLKEMLYVFVGLMIIFTNIIPCLYFWSLAEHNKNYYVPAIVSTISIVFGILFIFWHNIVLDIILGVWLVLLPILRIIFSDNKHNEFKRQIPYFIVAILLFFLPVNDILKIVVKVVGSTLMAVSIIAIILLSVAIHKANNDKNNKGNGSTTPPEERDLIDVEVREL